MSVKSENTKSMIVEKAYSLFARKGFNAVTMKDVCLETGLSRGGLYAHFGSTSEIFREVLGGLDFENDSGYLKALKEGKSATEVFLCALNEIEDEMNSSADSLSLAIYEYSACGNQSVLEEFASSGKKIWAGIIKRGIQSGEFNKVKADEIAELLMFAYQGVRMWSRIITVSPAQVSSILSNIKRQVIIGYK